MPKVFIPQVPSRRDAGANAWVPTVNLDPARLYGDIVVMLPPEASRLPMAKVKPLMEEMMNEYTKEDCVMAVGDPTVYAVATCLAAIKTNGLLRMLKWDRLSSSYNLVEIQL